MNKRKNKILISNILAVVLFLSIVPLDNVFAAANFNTANVITLNEYYADSLDYEEDINYYKFTTSKDDSFYNIEIRNTEATDYIELSLYSGDDETTKISSLIANTADVEQEARKLEPNHTYYIAVKSAYYYRSSIGNYKLKVTEIKDDAPENFKNSKSIPINKKVTYKLDVVGDTDYYKFTTTKNNSFYDIELSNSEATDTIGAFLYSSDDSTTNIHQITVSEATKKSIVCKLKPNHTYYIIVKNPYDNYIGDPTGSYKLRIKEIKDDAPDSFKNSVKLSVNKKHIYKMNVDGDIDYFKFKTSKKGLYTINLANGCGNTIDPGFSKT